MYRDLSLESEVFSPIVLHVILHAKVPVSSTHDDPAVLLGNHDHYCDMFCFLWRGCHMHAFEFHSILIRVVLVSRCCSPLPSSPLFVPSLMFQVDGEVAGLTLIVPSLHPPAGAERAIREVELCTLPLVSLEPGINRKRSLGLPYDPPHSLRDHSSRHERWVILTCLQGLKSSPLARIHLW